MLRFIDKKEFELGFKHYKKDKTFYRFELENGNSPLEGNFIKEKAKSKTVTLNTNLGYLLYNIYNYYENKELNLILYEIKTNVVKSDWEEENWRYCIIKEQKELLKITFLQLEEIFDINRSKYKISTISQLKKALKKI